MHCVEDEKIVDNHHILSLLHSVEMEVRRDRDRDELKLEFLAFISSLQLKDMKKNFRCELRLLLDILVVRDAVLSKSLRILWNKRLAHYCKVS
jgi:hypothetical protein